MPRKPKGAVKMTSKERTHKWKAARKEREERHKAALIRIRDQAADPYIIGIAETALIEEIIS
jgi:hypothetical protein